MTVLFCSQLPLCVSVSADPPALANKNMRTHTRTLPESAPIALVELALHVVLVDIASILSHMCQQQLFKVVQTRRGRKDERKLAYFYLLFCSVHEAQALE